MKLGSSFASSAGASGGNSTTSSAVRRSGGSAAVGLAPLSSVNESPAGAVSVTHSLADGVLPGSSVTRLSNSAIALSLASRAVTTRRMSAAAAAEHARRSATIEPITLLVIAFSSLCPLRLFRRPGGIVKPSALAVLRLLVLRRQVHRLHPTQNVLSHSNCPLPLLARADEVIE